MLNEYKHIKMSGERTENTSVLTFNDDNGDEMFYIKILKKEKNSDIKRLKIRCIVAIIDNSYASSVLRDIEGVYYCHITNMYKSKCTPYDDCNIEILFNKSKNILKKFSS